MQVPSRKSFVLASTALGLSLVGFSAKAYPPLPNLPNLNFTDLNGTGPKSCFVSSTQCHSNGGVGAADPAGWTGGTGLIFIDGTSNSDNASSSTYLQTYYSPSVLTLPNGHSYNYNYVEADGNPTYESGFNYTVTGLTAGQTYTLSFYQAASQQTGFSGATTNQWIVGLGTAGLSVTYNGGHTEGTYGDSDGTASVQATPLMHVPSEGIVDWNYVSVNLTADASTDILSFLAWGNQGSTANEPPMAFLTGVDAPPGEAPSLPEPVGMSLFGVGLAGMAVVARRRRKRSKAA